MINYISTRGGVSPARFSDILLQGLASDGGLYVPDSWPHLSDVDRQRAATMPYDQAVAIVAAKLAPDIAQAEWLALAQQAYRPELFSHVRKGSDAKDIFPLRQIEEGLHLLELSNGPTLAFKDAAMQLLGVLMEKILAAKDETLTILGATSGDTGSAAIHALRGKKRVKVVMLSPAGRMSAFQRAQMYSILDDNIMNLAVQGTFDDCQDLVKAVNQDLAFKARYHIGAVNSINWARLLAQAAYYVVAACKLAPQSGGKVSFSVPSGNFGNAFSGWVAKAMGAPIDRIIVATNENDVLHRLFSEGVYAPAGTAQATSSPSMDITKASNFERAVYEAAAHDGARVSELWFRLEQTGKIDFARDEPDIWHRLQAMGFVSSASTHAERLATIREMREKTGLFVDPHTADGLCAARKMRREGETMIALETAQAAKFASTMVEALGFAPIAPEAFRGLEQRPQRVDIINKDVEDLKRRIAAFTGF